MISTLELMDTASGFAEAGRLARFWEITRQTGPLRGLSILDVGCGAGDLYAYLDTGDLSYTGIDRDSGLIACAQTRYGKGFHVADLADEIFYYRAVGTTNYDWVVASSALCLESEREQHQKILERMWALAGVGIVFNVLSEVGPPPQRTDLRRWKLHEINSLVSSFNCYNYTLHQGYRGCDLTVALRK